MYRLSILSTLFSLLALVSDCHAVTIDSDTALDSSSPLNGEAITVVDGVGGSTSVLIATGASVAGFDLQGASRITLDGGEVTYLSKLSGHSVLNIQAGRIACTEPICSAISYDAIVTAYDQSSVVISGGEIFFEYLRLRDQSTLTVIGGDLSITRFGGELFLKGTLADGSLLNLAVRGTPDPSSRIFLVPEPASCVQLLVMGTLLARFVRGWPRQS